MKQDTILRARSFATKAHEGQTRKYTGEPYIVHPIAVANIVSATMGEDREDMISAALLHDVVEDTSHTIADIDRVFGSEIAELVDALTDVSRLEDGNRAVRKNLDLIHISQASPDAKTIKLADLIDNSKTIIQYGGGFAPIFMSEKRKLLGVLMEGASPLFAQASLIVENYLLNHSRGE